MTRPLENQPVDPLFTNELLSAAAEELFRGAVRDQISEHGGSEETAETVVRRRGRSLPENTNLPQLPSIKQLLAPARTLNLARQYEIEGDHAEAVRLVRAAYPRIAELIRDYRGELAVVTGGRNRGRVIHRDGTSGVGRLIDEYLHLPGVREQTTAKLLEDARSELVRRLDKRDREEHRQNGRVSDASKEKRQAELEAFDRSEILTQKLGVSAADPQYIQLPHLFTSLGQDDPVYQDLLKEAAQPAEIGPAPPELR